jgi:hypothetical protein
MPKRNQTIILAVTSEEKANITDLSQRLSMSVAQFIKSAAFEKMLALRDKLNMGTPQEANGKRNHS